MSRNALAVEERRIRAMEKVKRKEQAEGIAVAERRLGNEAKEIVKQ